MAKVSIKSEKFTPFRGIFHGREFFFRFAGATRRIYRAVYPRNLSGFETIRNFAASNELNITMKDIFEFNTIGPTHQLCDRFLKEQQFFKKEEN